MEWKVVCADIHSVRDVSSCWPSRLHFPLQVPIVQIDIILTTSLDLEFNGRPQDDRCEGSILLHQLTTHRCLIQKRFEQIQLWPHCLHVDA